MVSVGQFLRGIYVCRCSASSPGSCVEAIFVSTLTGYLLPRASKYAQPKQLPFSAHTDGPHPAAGGRHFISSFNVKPLHVIASGVTSKKAVVLTSKGGHFKTLRELTECMRASMLLPGITGPMVSCRKCVFLCVDLRDTCGLHTYISPCCILW